MTEVKLPELGDGIESGDVLEIFVTVGDVITKGQDIVEMETDKATVPVPSTAGGKVTKISVREGETRAHRWRLDRSRSGSRTAASAAEPTPAEPARVSRTEGAAPAEAKPEPPKPAAAEPKAAESQPTNSSARSSSTPAPAPAAPAPAAPAPTETHRRRTVVSTSGTNPRWPSDPTVRSRSRR